MAVVDASYVWPTPGVNGANVAGGPTDSDSVAGTVPLTGVVGSGSAAAESSAALPPRIGSVTLLARVSSVTGTLFGRPVVETRLVL